MYHAVSRLLAQFETFRAEMDVGESRDFCQDYVDYLVREFVVDYNETRPHANRNHRPLKDQSAMPEWETIRFEEVVCRERLGGVIKSMHRRAA